MAGDIIEGVKPTRMELLNIKKRCALAQKGHKLLSEKRDALVVEFFDIIKDRNRLRAEADEEIRKAFGSLVKAEMLMGTESVALTASTTPSDDDILVDVQNVMGVAVPRVVADEGEAKGLNYGLLNTSAALDDSQARFRSVYSRILSLAEIEGSIERLAVEIEKTKRRVNALEHIFIPKMKATERYIEMQLEEREREDFFRRKRIKALLSE